MGAATQRRVSPRMEISILSHLCIHYILHINGPQRAVITKRLCQRGPSATALTWNIHQ